MPSCICIHLGLFYVFQRGNPILKHIRNVPWEYGSIIPDYVMGKANCALFLRLVSFRVSYPLPSWTDRPSCTGIYPILKTVDQDQQASTLFSMLPLNQFDKWNDSKFETNVVC